MRRLSPPNGAITTPNAPLTLNGGYDNQGRNRGPLIVILLFLLVGILLLRAAVTPTDTTTQPTAQRPSPTLHQPQPTTAYQLPEADWQRLAIEATAVAQQLAEIDGRLQAATNMEREQLQNDRTRLQNAAQAIEITRAALDAHNSAAATAETIRAEATNSSQLAAHIARGTDVALQATANHNQTLHQQAQAQAQLAQAKADRAAIEATTAATLGQIITLAAIALAAIVTLALAFVVGGWILTHGRAILAQTKVTHAPPPPSPQPTPSTAEQDPTQWVRDLINEAEATRRRNAPVPTQTPITEGTLPEVGEHSSTPPVDVRENSSTAKIRPSTPLTPEIRARIVAEFRAQNSSVRATSRAIFTYGNGDTDNIVRQVLDEAQVNQAGGAR